MSDSQEGKAMDKRIVSSRKIAALSGKRTLVIAACVCAGLGGRAIPVHAQTPEILAPSPIPDPPPPPPAPPPPAEVDTPAPVIPNHLVAGNQIFEANVTGLRDYLESIKTSEPQVYRQLAPDVERLESARTTARAVLATGVVLGLAAGIYAFAGRPDCPNPSLSDPNFVADSNAWSSCNEHNINMMTTFGFLGVGAIAAGGLAAWAIAPSRSDLLEVINKNNRLSREPLRLQLGYDPSHELAFAGATLAF